MSVLQNIVRNALMAGAVCFSPFSGYACGFNWSPFGAYFECCDDSGYVLLTEKLADLQIPGESGTVPLWMWFSSRTAMPSPYAGLWRIGILDMSLVQTREDQYRMSDPGGSETLLSWDRKEKVLKGPGWKGEIVGGRVKLWASCGWSVEFNRGRVARMTTLHNKTLVYAYADGRLTGLSCDGKPLIELGRLDQNTLDITVNGKKLGIVKTDMPFVQRVGKADVIRGTEKCLQSIEGRGDEGRGRSYTYLVDEKMRPMITCRGKQDSDTFTLVWNPQTRKIVRGKDWYYIKTNDSGKSNVIFDFLRTNATVGVESIYRTSGGVSINQRGTFKRSEYHFTSGPASGKPRKVEETVDGKITHLEKYAYDEKGRPIRGEVDADKLRFEYNDKVGTSAAWKNEKLLWKIFTDAQGRTVKVEYPGKELRLVYRDAKAAHPVKAELVKGEKSIAVQLDGEGLVKAETASFKGIK